MPAALVKSTRCTAKAKQTGNRCKNPAIKGGKVCKKHGGAAPQVALAAEVRAAKLEAVAEAERMMGRAGVQADPMEHLLESLHRAAALVEIWGRMVAGLDAAAQREYGPGGDADLANEPRGSMRYSISEGEDGETWTTTTPADRLVTVNNRGEAQVHPFVAEYHAALDRRAKYADMAIRAGVAEHQVRIAEQQAQIIAGVIQAALMQLGVGDHPDAPRIVRAELEKVTGAGA